MNYIESAIKALEQEKFAIEKMLAETTERLNQVSQAIQTMRTVCVSASNKQATPIRPLLKPQEIEQPARVVGFTKGIRAQVMRALAGGSASSLEVASVTRIDERDIRHALSTMESEKLCARFADGKYALTQTGRDRAEWLLQHPQARQFGGNHRAPSVTKNGDAA